MSTARPLAWLTGPAGATSLDADEAEELLPSHITTQGELNAWEQLNIARADEWALSRRRRTVASVLAPTFAIELHRRMFDQTWTWAGRFRRTGKNIGVPARQISVALRERLTDAALWVDEQVYEPDEIAARLHHHLVLVHPWPNGNGRWARLMADALLHAERGPRFSWGSERLDATNTARARYLTALRAADEGDFSRLLLFVRS